MSAHTIVFIDDRYELTANLRKSLERASDGERTWKFIGVTGCSRHELIASFETEKNQILTGDPCTRPLVLMCDGAILDELPDDMMRIWRYVIPELLDRYGKFFDFLALQSVLLRTGQGDAINKQIRDARDRLLVKFKGLADQERETTRHSWIVGATEWIGPGKEELAEESFVRWANARADEKEAAYPKLRPSRREEDEEDSWPGPT